MLLLKPYLQQMQFGLQAAAAAPSTSYCIMFCCPGAMLLTFRARN